MKENETIPPYRAGAPRTLVLCFDGTGGQFLGNSNVAKFFSLLKRDNHREQMVYYQTGIGTYTSPQLVTPVGRALSMTADKMFAWNLSAHVIDGYEFLMQNYEKGDKICLFGFSRGAYTARALAGMLHKVGLLPRCNRQQVTFAYKMCKRSDKRGWEQSKEFKKRFSIDVHIDFIGVWDTVCSVGFIPHRLSFASCTEAIRVFRHALSLDERRISFEANYHHGHSALPEDVCDKLHSDVNHTDVKEVWFAGSHSDVGGMSQVDNDSEQPSLARIPLRWMIREVFRAHTGIRFHTEPLRELGLDPASLWPHAKPERQFDPVHAPPFAVATAVAAPNISLLNPTSPKHSRADIEQSVGQTQEIFTDSSPQAQDVVPAVSGHPGLDSGAAGSVNGTAVNELQKEQLDAGCPIHDQLRHNRWWWILELIPMKRCESEKWYEYTLNFGRGRAVPPDRKLFVHHSVNMRKPYTPKATWGDLPPIFVD